MSEMEEKEDIDRCTSPPAQQQPPAIERQASPLPVLERAMTPLVDSAATILDRAKSVSPSLSVVDRIATPSLGGDSIERTATPSLQQRMASPLPPQSASPRPEYLPSSSPAPGAAAMQFSTKPLTTGVRPETEDFFGQQVSEEAAATVYDCARLGSFTSKFDSPNLYLRNDFLQTEMTVLGWAVYLAGRGDVEQCKLTIKHAMDNAACDLALPMHGGFFSGKTAKDIAEYYERRDLVLLMDRLEKKRNEDNGNGVLTVSYGGGGGGVNGNAMVAAAAAMPFKAASNLRKTTVATAQAARALKNKAITTKSSSSSTATPATA